MLCHLAAPAPRDLECTSCRHPCGVGNQHGDRLRFEADQRIWQLHPPQEHEGIDQTTKDEEVDLAEHEHYTDALFQPGLTVAETGSPGFRSQEIRALARWTAKAWRRAKKEIAGKQDFFTLKGAQYECSLNEPICAILPSLRM